MGKYFTNKELTKKAFEKYRKLLTEIKKNEEELGVKSGVIDGRDYGAIFVALLDGDLESKTIEEYKKDYATFVKDLNANPKQYFDKVYDIFDSFQIKECDNEKDLFRAFSYTSMNQAFATIIERNPEYRDVRYGKSLDDMKFYDCRCTVAEYNNEMINNELVDDYSINISMLNYNGVRPNFNDGQDEWDEKQNYEFNAFREAYSRYSENKVDHIDVTITDIWNNYEEVCDPDSDLSIKGAAMLYPFNTCSKNPNGFSGKCANAFSKEKTISTSSGVFEKFWVDGKPMSHYLNECKNYKEYRNTAITVLANAMKDGKPVDFVETRMLKGKAQLDIIPLKFNMTKEAKEGFDDLNFMSHSWVHRNLFNWGPFKITNPVNYDTVYEKNLRSFEERKAQINDYFDKNTRDIYESKYPSIIEEERLDANRTNPDRNKYLEIPKIYTKENRNSIPLMDLESGREILNEVDRDDLDKSVIMSQNELDEMFSENIIEDGLEK